MQRKFDSIAAAKSVNYARKQERAKYYARKQKGLSATEVVMGVIGFERPERLESERQIFRTMQGTRCRKHGARGGHDKVKCGSVISIKRFEGSRSTCVYKHHRDF